MYVYAACTVLRIVFIEVRMLLICLSCRLLPELQKITEHLKLKLDNKIKPRKEVIPTTGLFDSFTKELHCFCFMFYKTAVINV